MALGISKHDESLLDLLSLQNLDTRLTGIETRIAKLEAYNKGNEKRWLPRVLGGESPEAAASHPTPAKPFSPQGSQPTTTPTTTTATTAPILDVIPPSEAVAEIVTAPSPPPPPAAPPAGFPSSASSSSWFWRTWGYLSGGQGSASSGRGSSDGLPTTTGTSLECAPVKVIDKGNVSDVRSDRAGGGVTK